jgi:hypothetical protein
MVYRDDPHGLSDRVDMAHGLVTRLYCCVVVEDEHLSFEPADGFGQRLLLGQYHHALSELGAPDLFQCKAIKAERLVRIETGRRGFCRATHETLCPASAVSTSTRFFCIDLMLVGMNCPRLSGPRRTLSPTAD